VEPAKIEFLDLVFVNNETTGSNSGRDRIAEIVTETLLTPSARALSKDYSENKPSGRKLIIPSKQRSPRSALILHRYPRWVVVDDKAVVAARKVIDRHPTFIIKFKPIADDRLRATQSVFWSPSGS
jgi:hypothetical protein